MWNLRFDIREYCFIWINFLSYFISYRHNCFYKTAFGSFARNLGFFSFGGLGTQNVLLKYASMSCSILDVIYLGVPSSGGVDTALKFSSSSLICMLSAQTGLSENCRLVLRDLFTDLKAELPLDTSVLN